MSTALKTEGYTRLAEGEQAVFLFTTIPTGATGEHPSLLVTYKDKPRERVWTEEEVRNLINALDRCWENGNDRAETIQHAFTALNLKP